MNFLDSRLPDRFWSKCIPEPNSGCWLWIGGLNYEYGTFWLEHRQRRSHRVSYEALVGPIPPDLVIDHLCRTTNCVNPAHLEPVTGRENVLRGETFAAANSRKERCPYGHSYDASNTFRTKKGRECVQCRARHRRAYLGRSSVQLNSREAARRLTFVLEGICPRCRERNAEPGIKSCRVCLDVIRVRRRTNTAITRARSVK
jgi:hypothetical protein